MASESEKADTVDSDEAEEDQYEVERIIDMRTEAGEVLYRVRWKNYASDDDTWEPEAHLEDCREVLLAYKRHLAEAKANREQDAKKGSKLPMKSDVFQAESSDSDRQRPTEQPVKKKKKKKTRHEDEPSSKEKRKKKKDKRKDDFRPRPAPSSDEEQEEERAPSPAPSWSRKDKTSDSKKRVVDSEDEEDVPPKKHKKEKSKDGGKHSKAKAEEGKKKKKDDTKGRRLEVESSEDESAAPLEEDLSDSQSDVPSKKKTGKSELKLKGIKDFLQDKKSKKAETSSPTPSQKESSLAKLKSLTSSKSQAREEAAEQSSDSGDSSTLHKKSKSKAQESAPAPAKVPSSASSTSSSSSMVTASTSKARDEEPREDVSREKEQSSSTNLFDKFLLNCEAKDHAKAARRQTVHPPAAEPVKAPKLIGKIEKRSKPPADKPEDKAERSRHADDDKAEPEADTMGDKRAEETAQRSKFRDDSRDRRDRLEDVQRAGWERRTPTSEAMDRRRKREDSEPRLFMACDDNLDPQDSLEGSDKSDKGQASLSLGMDLNLDWMVMDEFQKHLNGEDELLSAPPLSPSELRDAVKSGDYMSVKLALNSKEDYNLDQEDSSGMSLSMLAAAGGHDDILRLLIKKGVKMNGRQKNGTTALMHAAEKNFLTTVAILLEAGAYVNAQTLVGETALMKACKRGNADVVRLLLEYGADCNITSKHKTDAMHFASNNLVVYDLIKDHVHMLSSVAEDTIRAYFESRLALLEPVFRLACHRLCEGPDFTYEFCYKPPPHSPGEGSGIILFIFHANFQSEVSARLCGPCAVHAVVLNDKFQLPIFLDSHFIYSFSPVPGVNKLFIRLAESPTAKVKLLICAYRVQLQ